MRAKIVALSDIADSRFGGKAFGLAQLQRMGLAVPPAFVLSNARSQEYPDDLREQCERLGAVRFAVRSSALGEDGSEASFAGQYESVLDVPDYAGVCAAIDHCVASTDSDRALHYRQTQGDEAGESAPEPSMNIVVQAMVDARCAGVVFTTDPVSARRDRLVIDVVAGLGEALVSGEATPDHYEIDSQGSVCSHQQIGDEPLLRADELALLARQAREAARLEGQPLDLEWAIDGSGQLFWLQARPITTLPADLNEFDTPLPRPDDVLTISNVSEMMPGAVSPLTGSYTGWCIDYGLQDMQVKVGARRQIDPAWQITAWSFGHLFLNLTGNVVMSSAVLGSNAEQTAQTLCGRLVPELKDLPPQPFLQRLWNTGKLLRYALRAPAVVEQFGEELQAFEITAYDNSQDMWAELAGKLHFYEHAMAVHIQSSALSGFLSSIVENMVTGGSYDSSSSDQAEAVGLLAGASDVESALMLKQLDELVDRVAANADAHDRFVDVDAQSALEWLRATPVLCEEFARFMSAHGHRGYRELCMRDPAWRDDPLPLVQSMQAAARSRQTAGVLHQQHTPQIDWDSLGRGMRWILPKAHNAIRRREHTKSQLVEVAYRYKQAFKHLGQLLTREGSLTDPDLVYFFGIDELPAFIAGPEEASVERAQQRRDALSYQQKLSFPEISVGDPQPIPAFTPSREEDSLVGRPASRGVAEGVARVAHSLEEAAALQAGEILVTPITDIGWTPYFSMISALVTDLGSSVSHGAVIAREYGLPCVVNSRYGTQLIQTGDLVRVDGDSGIVERLSSAADTP